MKRLETLFRDFEDDFDEVFEIFTLFKSDPTQKTKAKLLRKIRNMNVSKNYFTHYVRDFVIIKKEP